MNTILIESQDKKITYFVKGIAIGRRNPDYTIGEKLNKLMLENDISSDELTRKLDINKNAIKKILKNEVPNKEMLQKIIKYFKVTDDYFEDKELENLIISDNNIVIGKYDTNKRALEVKYQLDTIIKENHRMGKPIQLEMPEK